MMNEKNVRTKSKEIAWNVVQPILEVFFQEENSSKIHTDLSKIIAGAIENVILEEWCKFRGKFF